MWWRKTGRFWKHGLPAISLVFMILLLWRCIPDTYRSETSGTSGKEHTETVEEKGYDLPVEEKESAEAKAECERMLTLFADIYKQADKGSSSNVVLSDETIFQIQSRLKEKGFPITTTVTYSNMENFEAMDKFLSECMEGKEGAQTVYEVHSDGGIERREYIFDGSEMYVLSTRVAWNEEDRPELSYCSYDRIKAWNYTEKGWFGYELCVPEPPEVTELVDGSFLVRIRPMDETHREMSEKCVSGLGYQGNNLLCSDWDAQHMETLDYNGMYEYLYEMKYGERFPAEEYADGIPEETFEGLIMEYLPVTAEQIREHAVFDEEHRTYPWRSLGCSNYGPAFFGTSLPEVTDIRENEDGTVTLTVDAVCDMVIWDDAFITHELTVRFAEDGSFQYLGNKILGEGGKRIPDYQYRMP